jgi:hypothetical protein
MRDLKCVKPIAGWDQGLAEHIHADVLAAVLDAAEVDEATWNKAWAMVMFDGEYGPGLDEDEDMSVAKARTIVSRAVANATFHNYPWDNPGAEYGPGTDACPECDGEDVETDGGDEDDEHYVCNGCGHEFSYPNVHYEPNDCLDATTIRREVFAGYFRIYGG